MALAMPFKRRDKMNICKDGHEEIIFNGKDCPLCDALCTKDDLETEVETLCDEIEELKLDNE
jgi:hypothetical protein